MTTTEKRVEPYDDPVRTKREMSFKTYEYIMPFNYPNVDVVRKYANQEFHGLEMNPINSRSPDPDHLPADHIDVVEEHPIVSVVVIGSACNPPGYITLEAEPTDDFRRWMEVPTVVPLRFRVDNLWGMHMRCDQWRGPRGAQGAKDFAAQPAEDNDIPENFKKYRPQYAEGVGYRCQTPNMPMLGMSSATFDIPASTKIMISGGSAIAGWQQDNYPDDAHYSFRIIRVTVDAS